MDAHTASDNNGVEKCNLRGVPQIQDMLTDNDEQGRVVDEERRYN